MKFSAIILSAFMSSQALAAALVPVAICKGKQDGKKVSVEAQVNPNNWCEHSPANDKNSVILLKEGKEVTVFTSITSEIETDETSIAVLTSSEAGGVAKLTYDQSSGAGKLEMISEDETTEIKLQCELPQYTVDC